MRRLVGMALIGGGAVVALGLGTAAAVAATGDGRDDRPAVVQTVTPAPVTTPTDDRGTDNPATHDGGDDHGSGGHGSDD